MGKTKRDDKAAAAAKNISSSSKKKSNKADAAKRQRASLVEVEAHDEEVQRSKKKNTVSISRRLGTIKKKHRLDARDSLLRGDRITCKTGGKKRKPDATINSAAISWMDKALSEKKTASSEENRRESLATKDKVAMEAAAAASEEGVDEVDDGGLVRRFVHSAMATTKKTGAVSKLPYTTTYRVVKDVLRGIYGTGSGIKLRAGPKTIELIIDSVVEVCDEVTKRAMINSGTAHLATLKPDMLKAAYLTMVMDPLRTSRSFLPSVDRLPVVTPKARTGVSAPPAS